MRAGDGVKRLSLALVLVLASCGKKPAPPEDPIEKLGADLGSSDEKKRKAAAADLAGRGAAGADRLGRELANPSKPVRLTAVKSLAKMREEAIPHLCRALQDREWEVKAAAARGLARHGAKSRAAIPDLIAILEIRMQDLKGPDGQPVEKGSGADVFAAVMGLVGAQTEADRALGAIGPEAWDPLLDAFNRAKPDVKPVLAGALCRFGEKALPIVEKVARFAPTEARQRLVRSLGALGPCALPLVLEMSEDPDAMISLGANDALREIGAPAADALRLMLKDPSPKKRIFACERLGWFAQYGDTIKPDLKEVMAKDADAKVRKEAREALEFLESMESMAKDPEFRKEMTDFAKDLTQEE